MKTSILRPLLALSLLAIIGCANPHSVPTSRDPQRVAGRTMKIWVDQDGTFYPADWQDHFGEPAELPGRSAYSLWAIARDEKPDDEEQQLRIEKAEKSVMARYRDFISDKKRLFILVHGYNNNEREANDAYEPIQKKIAFKKGDGVVEFYWDGLTAKGVRPLLIWFKATGNSQLVGTRGLRKLLNATHGKEIVFITHSRGASVLFSALSDPPYDPGFVAKTKRTRGFGVYEEPPLQENNNHLSALLLAPAIGAIDFRSRENVGPMRDFDKQLEEVYYSVNSKDWVLNKFIGLSKYFNASDMGLRIRVANAIDAADKPRKRFRHKEWEPMRTHGFPTYVENEQFIAMLEDMKIDVQEDVRVARDESPPPKR